MTAEGSLMLRNRAQGSYTAAKADARPLVQAGRPADPSAAGKSGMQHSSLHDLLTKPDDGQTSDEG